MLLLVPPTTTAMRLVDDGDDAVAAADGKIARWPADAQAVTSMQTTIPIATPRSVPSPGRPEGDLVRWWREWRTRVNISGMVRENKNNRHRGVQSDTHKHKGTEHNLIQGPLQRLSSFKSVFISVVIRVKNTLKR